MAAVIKAMQEGAGEMEQVRGLDTSFTYFLFFSYLLYFSLVVSAVRCFSSPVEVEEVRAR